MLMPGPYPTHLQGQLGSYIIYFFMGQQEPLSLRTSVPATPVREADSTRQNIHIFQTHILHWQAARE